MIYKEFKNGKYNIHFIKTDKFKTIGIEVIFKRPIVKREIAVRNILLSVMLESTKKLPSRRLLEIESENLYNLNYNISSHLSGNYNALEFSVIFLNENYTELGMNEKSVEFLSDLIFNPDIENNSFKAKAFKNAKNALVEDLNTFNDSPRSYSSTRLYEEMFKDSILSYRAIGYKEDLDGITESNLYDDYKDIIKNDYADIFVIGNFNEDNMLEIIKKYFPSNETEKERISHFVTHDSFRSEVNRVTEKKDYLQSTLMLGYKIEDLTDFEKQYVSYVYSFILGGSSNSKLFKTVREENSLCYSISSHIKSVSSSMVISAGINASDSEKAIQLINKCVQDMSDGNFDESEINNAIITYINALSEIEDEPSSILNSCITQNFFGYDSLEKRKENITKVTKEMIISLGKKIHLDTIYLLEGNGD